MVHEASCPEAAPLTCASQPIPDHLHSQGLTLLRLEPGLSIGLGRGFQLSFQLPVDIKTSRISYLLPNGTPFDPPYGNVHHRNETLFGTGDALLMARWGVAIPATPVILAIGLGAALPTGKTEEDPFDAASREEFHQHMQFGNGTVDPLGAFQLIVQGKSVGLLASARTRVPVYANEKGYRGSIQVAAAVGPTLRLPEPLRTVQLSLTGEFQWLSAELWNDSPGENSGLITAGMRMGLIWNVRPSLAIQANLLARVYERSSGAQFTRPATLTLGISGFLDLRSLGKNKAEADTHQH